MGYVPLFDTLTTGSLYGRWPDIGLWPVVLSMADRNGKIDVTPAYISGVTGLDVAEVVACLERFCAPDPDSRTWTPEDEGRRLALIDPERKWGWKVLNHGKYREKARLLARDAERTASGMDAERKRNRQPPEVPRFPPKSPESPEFPPSDGDGDKDEDKKQKKRRASAPPPFDPASVPGLDLTAWQSWVEHRTAIHKTIRPHSLRDAAEELAKLGDRQQAEVKRARAGGWQGLHPDDRPNGSGSARPTRYEELMRQAAAPAPAEPSAIALLLAGDKAS